METTPTPKDAAIGVHEPDSAHYPESDGKPMADSMGQAQWMNLLFDNLTHLYRDDANVLVATDLLWYPVRGRPDIVLAPDVMVIFGRPKYLRGSYRQFEEEGTPPQVVFEIVSESNTADEMTHKAAFYQRYGVREFYLYDHENGGFSVVLFTPEGAQTIAVESEWTSPLLGVRFVPKFRAPMEMYYPGDTPFRSFTDVHALMDFERQQRDVAREQRDAERERADTEATRADDAEAELVRLRALLAERSKP